MDMTLTFGLLPGVAGAFAGWALRHWPLAAAASAGLWGLFLVAPMLGAASVFVTPLLFGGALGAMTLTVWLVFSPAANVWTRMSVAMVAALAGGMGLLARALGGV